MGYWINWVTIFRNLFFSVIFGLVIPYYLVNYIDPSGLIFDLDAILFNGVIFAVVYTIYGVFNKDTVIRFFIGCAWIGTLIYFYTIGSNFFTFYIPHSGFGQLYIDGNYRGIDFEFGYNYMWVIIATLSLKGLNILRHLIKPPERKFKQLTISEKFGKK
ncbi:MAG: hypothetical protein ACTSQD_04040 [Promethearchaeota archaeon]